VIPPTLFACKQFNRVSCSLYTAKTTGTTGKWLKGGLGGQGRKGNYNGVFVLWRPFTLSLLKDPPPILSPTVALSIPNCFQSWDSLEISGFRQGLTTFVSYINS